MKKSRKRRTQPSPRFRRVRQTHGDLAFILTTPHESVQLGVSKLLGEEGDNVMFEVRFEPAMDRAAAANSYVTIVHVPTKRQDNQICILPTTDDKDLRRFDSDEQLYLVFPSHSARISWPDGLLVELVYLKLINIEIQGNVEAPTYQVAITVPPHERYVPVPYFPPVRLEKTRIDPTLYPQDLPLPFRSNVPTSSRVPKIIGYYPPGPETMSTWKRATIRFGRLNETIAVFEYLNKFHSRVFHEAGFFECPQGSAKPDGIIIDNSEECAENKDYADLPQNRGIIEVKCSTNNCQIEGAHIAQAIWEMMAVNVPWCDLVRYSVRKVKEDGLWQTKRFMRYVRLFRERKKEELLIEAVTASDSEKRTVVRKILDDTAHQANTHPMLAIETELTDNNVLDLFQEHRKTFFERHKLEVDVIDEALDRMEKRQTTIFSLFQDNPQGSEFKIQIAEQIQDLVELLKK